MDEARRKNIRTFVWLVVTWIVAAAALSMFGRWVAREAFDRCLESGGKVQACYDRFVR